MERPQLLAKMVRNPRVLGIVCMLFITLALPMPGLTAPTKALGMWVWSKSSFSTEEARQNLVLFCTDHHINHLDIHIEISSEGDKVFLPDAEALKDLIILAGRYNITTAALRGSPKMFFSENHDRTLRELQAIIAFHESLPTDSHFKGIKYDVEPYRTKAWKEKGSSLKTVILDYLTFLSRARSLLREEAPNLWLAVDMPFWWDKDEYVIEFEGAAKRLSEHVQDLTDFAVIMSYRRDVEQVLDCVKNERNYASRIEKVIFPALETVDLNQDQYISFWESTTREFWDVVPRLQEAAEKDPAMGGLMLHCYRSLSKKFNRSASDRAKKHRDPAKVLPELQ